MAYRKGSLWSDENEIRCLALMKSLQEEGFPLGKQAEYSREFADASGLRWQSINAKIGNFKSLAGLSGDSHWSTNSERVWNQYGHLSAAELDAL